MAKRVKIGQAYIEIGTDQDRLKRDYRQMQDQTKKAVNKMTLDWKKVGAVIAGAFGTQQIIQFGKEAVALAGKAQGVKQAFDRLNDPNLLSNLRKATRGTVSDLELMQTAVRAQNFKIPLSELGTLLEFAQKRATQTGESVDYLVNSIVDGIGRKSTLVLDNLGISATELQEEVKKIGDFGKATGNIVKRELEKMGDVAFTSKDRFQQLNAKVENLQVILGEKLIPTLDKAAEGAIEFADAVTEMDRSWTEWRKNDSLGKTIDDIEEFIKNTPSRTLKDWTFFFDFFKSGWNSVAKTIDSILGTSDKGVDKNLKSIPKYFEETAIGINLLKRQADKLKEVKEVIDETTEAVLSQAEAFDLVKFRAKEYYSFAIRQINEKAEEIKQTGVSEVAAEIWKYERLKEVAAEWKEWFETNIKPTFEPKFEPPESAIPSGTDTPDKPVPFDETAAELENITSLQDAVNQGFYSMANTAAQAGSEMFSKLKQTNNILLKLIASFGEAIVQALIFKTVAGLFGLQGGFAGISIFGAKHGGTVTNKGGGNVSINPHKKAATGLDRFVVPPGFNKDDYLIGVQSGETVTVTPNSYRGSNFSDTNIVKELRLLRSEMKNNRNAIDAVNVNQSRLMNRIRNMKTVIDFKDLGVSLIATQNELERTGKNISEITR